MTKISLLPTLPSGQAADFFVGVKGTTDYKVAAPVRIKLTADTIYYVSTTGADATGDGSIGNPWLTPQHAIDWIAANIDAAGFTVTIQFANGNYPGPNVVRLPPNAYCTNFQGNNSDQTLVSFDNTGPAGAYDGACFEYQPPFGPCQITSITFAPTSSSNHGVELDGGAGTQLYIVNCKWKGNGALGLILFTASNVVFLGVDQVNSLGNGLTAPAGNNLVSGNWEYWLFEDHYNCSVMTWSTVTLVGTPAFSGAFAYVGFGSSVFEIWHGTFSGAATGRRFEVCPTCSIFDDPRAASFTRLPGNAPGVLQIGGNYPQAPINNVATPSTGNTVSMTFLQPNQLLDPAAGLATLTVNLPPIPAVLSIAPLPIDSYVARVSTTHAITALTVATTDGSSIKAAPTTLAAGGAFAMIYNKADNTWYPSV